MEKSLTNRQIALILYTTIVGYSISDFPKIASKAAGTGAWVSIIIITIFAILLTYIITKIQLINREKNFYEFNNVLFGRIPSLIIILVFIVYFLVSGSLIVRSYSEIIKITILRETPILAISTVFFMVIYYAVFKKIRVIGSLCEIYGMLSMLGFLFINFLILIKGKVINIKPIFDISEVSTYIKGSKDLIYPFLGMEILFFINLKGKESKSLFRHILGMIVIIGCMYIYVVESAIALVGVEDLVKYNSTTLNIILGIDLESLELFRRLDGLYIMVWTLNIVCACCVWTYGTISFISDICKDKKKYNLICVIVIIASFLISQYPRNIEEAKAIMKINNYIGLILVTIFPIILLITLKVKKYENKKKK